MSDKQNTKYSIKPLIINELKGRFLEIPSKNKSKKRQILLIYGHHASIERMIGIAENLSEYGDVLMPDLPGFGGMDTFYKIKKKPNLDNLADYLATFIKLKYNDRQLTIGAMSFGFEIVTRMLQKYPELQPQVDLLVSLVGFSKYNDFKFKKSTLFLFKTVSTIFSWYIPSQILKHVFINGPVIKTCYKMVADKHVKMKDADIEERDKRIAFEIILWKCNDIRTYMYTGHTMITSDLTKIPVDVKMAHVSVIGDQYFNNEVVDQNLAKIYKDPMIFRATMANHAPTVISEAEDAAEFMPKDLRKILEKDPT